ncbi:MAG: hypothetical protein LAT51_07195 [Flavobacteriaceae bacterium]|nr:hypothetical protein [Flavobacteriaceae bacterium]
MEDQQQNKIIYTTQDGNVWMNQNQLAGLFDTSKQNIDQYIDKILKTKS